MIGSGGGSDQTRREPDMMAAVPHVYILRCRDGSLYTGAAKDLRRRLAQHEAGTASRYTRARRPVAVVWSRRCATWSRALKEEYRIKQLGREEKEELMRRSELERRRRRERAAQASEVSPKGCADPST